MEISTKKNETLIAALAHVSTFGKYIVPFSNFFLPIIIGAIKKENRFVNENVKQALNFQISLFLYYIVIAGLGIAGCLILATELHLVVDPDFDTFYLSDGELNPAFIILLSVTGILILGLFILDVVSVVTAAMKASEGNSYRYPLAISFLKSSNQSENEQFNDNNTKNETL